MIIDKAILIVNQTYGGTSNTNKNTNTSHTTSFNTNTHDADRTVTNVSRSTSSDEFANQVVSTHDTTSDVTSTETRVTQSKDQSSSRSRSNTSNLTTSNVTSFSQTDIDVSLIRADAERTSADHRLLIAKAKADADLGRLRTRLAFSSDVFNTILPLIQSAADAV